VEKSDLERATDLVLIHGVRLKLKPFMSWLEYLFTQIYRITFQVILNPIVIFVIYLVCVSMKVVRAVDFIYTAIVDWKTSLSKKSKDVL